MQILEFQRFDEYIKLIEGLRAHKEKAEIEMNENTVKKLAPGTTITKINKRNNLKEEKSIN